MKLPEIDLNELKDSDGYYSEKQKDALELLYGKSLKQLEQEAKENAKMEPPEGHPSSWQRSDKLAYIKSAGREAFERLCKERK